MPELEKPLVRCKYDALVDPNTLEDHPDNKNKHPTAQIIRLAKGIKYQGWRDAIVISNLSGKITRGHGRKLAGIRNKTLVPVIYQDYDNEAQEYADVQFDNAIASWAELDVPGIEVDLKERFDDGSLNLDMLGIEGFPPDDEDTQSKLTIDGEIPFSKELDEKNDYILLMFESKKEFQAACEKMGVKTVQTNLSPSGNPNFQITGIGRVIDGKSISDRL